MDDPDFVPRLNNDINILKEAVEQLKTGKVVLMDWLEVSDFLKTRKFP